MNIYEIQIDLIVPAPATPLTFATRYVVVAANPPLERYRPTLADAMANAAWNASKQGACVIVYDRMARSGRPCAWLVGPRGGKEVFAVKP